MLQEMKAGQGAWKQDCTSLILAPSYPDWVDLGLKLVVFFLTQSCSTAIDLWVLEAQSRNVVLPLRVAAVLNENSSKVALHFAGFTLLNASTEEGNNYRLMLILRLYKCALNLRVWGLLRVIPNEFHKGQSLLLEIHNINCCMLSI